MRITDKYVIFWGGPFSQWHVSPFVQSGIIFETAEHYMMYHKALILGSEDAAARVLMSHSPKVAKQIGRDIKATDEALKRWDSVKVSTVLSGNILKFSQDTYLLKRLLSHYPTRKFVEASPYDKIWGVGLSMTDPRVEDESKWQGQNLLGKALDKVASKLHGTNIHV